LSFTEFIRGMVEREQKVKCSCFLKAIGRSQVPNPEIAELPISKQQVGLDRGLHSLSTFSHWH